jgi:mono/diheme cytochrome c family protein
MRISALAICVCAFGLLAFTSACRQDMHDQPKYIPLRESDIFPNHQSARMFVEGTVARGSVPANASQQQTTQPANSATGAPADLFPFPITEEVLNRGQQRFNIYCAPCHSQLGDGNGMIVQRGFRRPPSFHTDRLRQAPASHFFDVVTNGFGAMYSYAEQIPTNDRWSIIAYIRALQLSQNAPKSLLNSGELQKLNAGGQQK